MNEHRRDYLTRIGPLLLATAIGSSAAAGSITNTVDEPAFEFILHMMILVAVGVSAVGGLLNLRTTLLGVIVIAVGIAALVGRVSPAPGVELLFPPEVLADEDLTWATLWSWLMVGFCFMLGRRRNVLFPLVAGLAIFGLVSTVNLNPIILVYFGIYIFAAAFIWGYEHLLNIGERLGAERGAQWLGIARTQALAGTLLVSIIVVGGLLIGSGLYHIGPRLFVGRSGMADYARYLQRSLLSYGGVSDSFQVGRGPVNLPATPAIRVRADRPALWRGSAYDYYTGDGWTRELEGSLRLEQDEDGWWRIPGTENLVGEQNLQEVTLLNMDATAMYGAAQPAMVRMAGEAQDQLSGFYQPHLDRYGAVKTQYIMTGGVTYEVVSVMPPSDPETLRATPARYPPDIVETYLNQMQVQAEAELGELVREIVAGQPNPYDRVSSIRDFLGTSCVYTTRAPAVPRGEDAAVWFVNNSQRGACDLFATSLAVMSRLAGVPARVATGFQVGSWDREEEAYIALQRDAHAWAEIYFTGIGWVPFDVAAEQVDEDANLFAWLSSGQWRRPLGRFMDAVGNVLFAVAVAAALVSAILGPSVLARWISGRIRRRTPREKVGEAFEWFRRKAARMARVRVDRWRTPAELQVQLADRGLAGSPEVREKLEEFNRSFNDHRYGRTEPTDREIGRVRAEARELLRELRRDRKSNSTRRKNNGDGQ